MPRLTKVNFYRDNWEALERWCEQAAAHRQGLLRWFIRYPSIAFVVEEPIKNPMGALRSKTASPKNRCWNESSPRAIEVSDARRLLLSAILSQTSEPDRFEGTLRPAAS